MSEHADGSKGTGRFPKRVVRTGIALVHENEIVYPAAGSEAQAQTVVEDASNAVSLFFPVTIEIADTESATPASESEDDPLRALAQAFRLA